MKKQWTGPLEGYDPHGFCKQLCAEGRKQLSIKMREIGLIKNGSFYSVYFPKPYDLVGSFRGCCKWHIIIQACDDILEHKKND